ncbi:phage tail tape measure protein [Desulfobacula toluolica]|uniref:Phage tail tape measure protein, TP901 family n=1 Tax=Desulfobacula toluolica (strain DSM 7467 / Tol2) TaxID=651182 RepID=K0NQJ1_DESTT|nr:phage tail tape measure protein [Desulfobacula toluolica]CCK81197.1 phage tail tape measure protein, TP901 family [Desulfobacula toluolica Tol2]
MSHDIDIKIKTKTEGSAEVQKLEKDLSALGKIESFKKLKKDVQESKAAWVAAQAEVSKLAKEIKAADQPTKDLSNRFNKAKKEAGTLKKAFQQNHQSLQKLRRSLKEAGINTENLSAEQKKLKQSLSQTRQEFSKAAKIDAAKGMLNVRPYKDIQSEIKQTGEAYNLLKKSGKLTAKELSEAKLQLKKRIRELKNETNSWSGSLSTASAGLAALAGIGFTFVKSFTGFSGFSQRMAEVNTLLDVSKDRHAALSKEILTLSTRIPQTASELAAAEYDIISAGVALEKSTTVLELSAKAAVAGVTDTKTAVNVGVSVINAYGKSIGELDDVYDILFQTVKSGVTTFPELAQHIGDVLPTARSAGVKFQDVATSIATMTKAGIKTPQAVTALKGAITAMAAPAPEAKKKFEELGITWEGLIPTLEAIRKKSLSMDQLRMLIPDVEARTAVMALTQNLDGLKEITDGMTKSAGSMQDAFDKMKDTPENQIKLFKNEISELGIELGGLVSKGLLPALKGIRLFKDAVSETDTPTKILLSTLAAGSAVFLLWKMGLSTVVLGLKECMSNIALTRASVGSLTTQFKAASLAMKAGLIINIAYTGVEIWKAVQAFREMRDAQKEAKDAQNRLYDSSDRIMKKFQEFKDVKLPEDITGTAPEELEELSRKLAKTKAYWVALQVQLQTKSEKTTFLGTATKEAIDAKAELKVVNQRIKEINSDLKKVKTAGEQAADAMKKPAEAVKATKEQLDDFEKQAKAAYKTAKAEAEKYAKKVIEWEDKIKTARMSTADKLRELNRKGMTDEEQWNDERLQADEKFYAAKEALRNGDYKLAETLAKDAEGLYAGLAEEIKSSTKDGEDIIVKSLDTTKEVAKDGVKAVGNFMIDLYSEQKDNAKSSQGQWEETAKAIQKQLDEITKKRETNVEIILENLEDAQSEINDLTRDETKTITITTIQKTVKQTVEEKQTGGPVGFASGGRLPGYGGGDKIKALLEAGEFVIRKEAVAKYGAGFFSKLNSMRLNLPDMQRVVKARIGGLISNLSLPEIPVQRFATGGMAMANGGQSPSETLVVRFQAGDMEAPVKITDPDSRMAIKKMAKEMSRMRLTYAR